MGEAKAKRSRKKPRRQGSAGKASKRKRASRATTAQGPEPAPSTRAAELDRLLRHGEIELALEQANALLAGAAELADAVAAHLAHARVALAEADLELAEEALDAAAALAPERVEVLAWRAHLELDRDRPEAALGLLRRARAGLEGSGHPVVHLALARLASATGDSVRAAQELDRALALDPDSVPLATQLALALIDAGDGEQAFEVLRRVCARHPREAPAWRLAGRLLAVGASAETALAWGREAIAACPDDPGLHLQLLAAASAARDFAAGRSSVEALRTLSPADAEVQIHIATFQLGFDKADLALASLQRAAGIDPATPGLRRHRAAALLVKARVKRQGRAARELEEEAIALLEAQIHERPEDWRARVDLASLLGQGDEAGQLRAADLLDAVLAEQPNDPAALVNRAALHLLAGQPRQARDCAKRAAGRARIGSASAAQAQEILSALER